MPKIDVGVGDEFPAKEVRDEAEEEEPMIHHHHYYRRYRRPGGWIRVMLWILVISFLFRAMNWLFDPPGAWGPHNGWGPYGGPWSGWGGFPFWGGWFPMAGLFSTFIVLGVAWWLIRCVGGGKDRP